MSHRPPHTLDAAGVAAHQRTAAAHVLLLKHEARPCHTACPRPELHGQADTGSLLGSTEQW